MTNKLGTDETAAAGVEPSSAQIYTYMEVNNIDFYNARERLREQAYGGKPPHGYLSWGDYWKGR